MHSGSRRGGNGERLGLIVDNKDQVILGIVPDFVGALAVVMGSVIARVESWVREGGGSSDIGAEVLHDREVLRFSGIVLHHLQRTVAIAHQDIARYSDRAIRPLIVRRGRSSAGYPEGWRCSDEARHLAHEYIMLGVYDIEGSVGPIRRIYSLGDRIGQRISNASGGVPESG